jgi:hypothetical protein
MSATAPPSPTERVYFQLPARDGPKIRLPGRQSGESMTVATSAEPLLLFPALFDEVPVPFQNAGTSAHPQV